MSKNGFKKKINKVFLPIGSFGISLFGMPIEFFVTVIIIIFVIIVFYVVKLLRIHKCTKKISKKMHRMVSEIKFINEHELKCLREKYEKKKEQRSRIYKKRKIVLSNLTTLIIIVLFFCLPRFEPIKILANQIFTRSYMHFTESIEQKEKESEQPIIDEKEEKIIFTIEYPDGHPLIKKKELEELYNRLFYDSENDLNEIIKSNIKIWLNSCKDNTSLDTAMTSSGKSTKYYSNIEKGFTNENNVRLSSNLLDEVISGRKELLATYPNGTLAWLLANHMQTYALNYDNQTSAKRSILYFYMKSIEYTQMSLEFEIKREIKYNRIRYLHARYKDIAESEKIDEGIRLHAYEIYIAIEDALAQLGIPLR